MTATENRQTIAVLLPMVWSVRNVVYSGILNSLARNGVHAHLIIPEIPDHVSCPEYRDFRSAAGFYKLISPMTSPARGKPIVDALLTSAFNKRHQNQSYGLYKRWFHRKAGLRQQFRLRVIEGAGTLAQWPPCFERLRHLSETLYRKQHDLVRVKDQLQRIRPALLWSTVCVSGLEYPYLLSARDLGIPVVASILSFDNLTSRGYLPTADYYTVWNQRMADQVNRFYPAVRPENIRITGTPQFDFHRNVEFLWPRPVVLKRLGLPESARYFLYATSNATLAPAEPELVVGLVTRMRREPRLKELYTVVRLHPLDNWTRWQDVANASDKVVISEAWDTRPDSDGWTLSQPDDQARFISSLAHAEACLNVASTTALDAAALNRPSIGIRFDREHDCPQDILYDEYDAEHYRPLVESGGVRVARNWAELMALMYAATSGTEQDGALRARMVQAECGMVDGKCGERVVGALLSILAALAPKRLYAAAGV